MIHTWPQWPAITVWDAPEINVHVRGRHPIPPHAIDPAESAWARLRAENPRLFDGPILTLRAFDDHRGAVECARTTYMWLAVQEELDTGVTLVAVNALVTARDRAGRTHLLLGRRSPQNRIYPGLWELSPAGSMDPPAQDGPLPEAALHDVLRRELREECGLLDPVEPRCIACYRDTVARSFNLVFHVPMRRSVEQLAPETRPTHWDCDAALWVDSSRLAAFAQDHPLIDASRALLAWWGSGR